MKRFKDFLLGGATVIAVMSILVTHPAYSAPLFGGSGPGDEIAPLPTPVDVTGEIDPMSVKVDDKVGNRLKQQNNMIVGMIQQIAMGNMNVNWETLLGIGLGGGNNFSLNGILQSAMGQLGGGQFSSLIGSLTSGGASGAQGALMGYFSQYLGMGAGGLYNTASNLESNVKSGSSSFPDLTKGAPNSGSGSGNGGVPGLGMVGNDGWSLNDVASGKAEVSVPSAVEISKAYYVQPGASVTDREKIRIARIDTATKQHPQAKAAALNVLGKDVPALLKQHQATKEVLESASKCAGGGSAGGSAPDLTKGTGGAVNTAAGGFGSTVKSGSSSLPDLTKGAGGLVNAVTGSSGDLLKGLTKNNCGNGPKDLRGDVQLLSEITLQQMQTDILNLMLLAQLLDMKATDGIVVDPLESIAKSGNSGGSGSNRGSSGGSSGGGGLAIDPGIFDGTPN